MFRPQIAPAQGVVDERPAQQQHGCTHPLDMSIEKVVGDGAEVRLTSLPEAGEQLQKAGKETASDAAVTLMR